MTPPIKDRRPSMSIFEGITVGDIKALRERLGCGLAESRRILRAGAALGAVEDMTKEGLLDPRMSELLNYLIERSA